MFLQIYEGVYSMAKAKLTEEQKQAKKDAVKALVKAFQDKPITEWTAMIEAQKGDEEKYNRFRACAKKALTYDNMMDYIDAKEPTAEARKAFLDGCWGTVYETEEYTTIGTRGENKGKPITKTRIVYLDADKKMPKPKMENGEPVKVKGIVYAVDYFTRKYFPTLLCNLSEGHEKKPKIDKVTKWANQQN